MVRLAAQVGLAGLAVTDHDTVEGLKEAIAAGKDMGLLIIPGIEFNTDYGNTEVHILGYNIDFEAPVLKERVQSIKKARQVRGREIVEKLNRLGYELDWEQVEKKAGRGVVGRPHIAMALMEKGWASSIDDAFTRLLGRGCPAYVPRYRFTPEEAVDIIHQTGGTAILAHPGLINDQTAFNHIIRLVEGVEAFYPEHSASQCWMLYRYAEENGMLVTAGSDFHGTSGLRSHLGSEAASPAMVEMLWHNHSRRI